ncbi:MAG: ABC transporter permease subunit, partial [Tepidanaerobacteraceae bacterium]
MMEHIEYFIYIWPDLFKGLIVSLQLSVGALLLGLAIGLPMALMRTYGRGLVKTLAVMYIELIRGTPMIVQLFLIYYGLPDMGILLDRLPAAIIALGINSSAYQAE